MTNVKNIVITSVVALVISILVGMYFVGKTADQSNLGGLSERDIQAVSLKVGTPTAKFNVNSAGTRVGIGTTTPTTQGDVVVDGTGTTTLSMMSSASGKGSCLQLETNLGAVVKAYIVGTSWVIASGTCK